MKALLKILFLGLLMYSCGAIPKMKSGNSFKIDRISIMDTLTVNVSGKVFELYDEFGLKIAELELTNSENSYSEICDVKGKFNFNHITAGKYLIYGSYPGYYQFRDSIELKAGEKVKLKIGLGFDE